VEEYWQIHNNLVRSLKTYHDESKAKRKAAQKKKLEESGFEKELAELAEIDVIKLPDISRLLDFDSDNHDNKTQLQFAAKLKEVVASHGKIADRLKKEHSKLLQIYKQAGKLLRVKQDKRWSDMGLIGADKNLLAAFASVSFADDVQEIRGVLDWPQYWFACMDWLQSRFPDGEYADVVGLCKAAEREEYAGEQDYSLNPGRYVGVVIEEDNISEIEFKSKLALMREQFNNLSSSAEALSNRISSDLDSLLG
jgi:type I restriction enzyme M protein